MHCFLQPLKQESREKTNCGLRICQKDKKSDCGKNEVSSWGESEKKNHGKYSTNKRIDLNKLELLVFYYVI